MIQVNVVETQNVVRSPSCRRMKNNLKEPYIAPEAPYRPSDQPRPPPLSKETTPQTGETPTNHSPAPSSRANERASRSRRTNDGAAGVPPTQTPREGTHCSRSPPQPDSERSGNHGQGSQPIFRKRRLGCWGSRPYWGSEKEERIQQRQRRNNILKLFFLGLCFYYFLLTAEFQIDKFKLWSK